MFQSILADFYHSEKHISCSVLKLQPNLVKSRFYDNAKIRKDPRDQFPFIDHPLMEYIYVQNQTSNHQEHSKTSMIFPK